MEFCPKCEVRLKKNDDGLLSCLKCNYVKEKSDKPTKEKPEEEVVKGFEKLSDDKVTKKLSDTYLRDIRGGM